jgi:Na+-transporting methylmalonyl-CoA/oxaloacetate decarboxylase gamma subunit
MEKIISKKLLLIVSMLAVTFALAGCTSSKKTVEFDYDPDTLAQLVQDKTTEYKSIADIPEQYDYVVELGEDAGIDESEIDAVKVISTLEDECGTFIGFESDYTYEEVDDTVVVSIYANCADQEAVIKATFEDNSVQYDFQKYMAVNSYGYTEEEADETLTSNGIYPYKISEFEVSANQTMKDKMKAAGANTVIGMGIVFVVLIFISFIISLLKYVPMLLDKDTREARKAEKAKKAQAERQSGADVEEASDQATVLTQTPAGIVDIVNSETGESVMNDSELVAVIAAAVTAASGTGARTRTYVNYPSNDKLVVRPRKRNKR